MICKDCPVRDFDKYCHQYGCCLFDRIHGGVIENFELRRLIDYIMVTHFGEKERQRDIVVFAAIDNLPELTLIDGVSQNSYYDVRGFHMRNLPERCLVCEKNDFVERGKYGSGGRIFTCRECLTLYIVCDWTERSKIVLDVIPVLKIDENPNLRPLSPYDIKMNKELKKGC